MRSGSRKVIQQEVEFSHSSAHKQGGVRGHGELSLVKSGLLWTGAFPERVKQHIRLGIQISTVHFERYNGYKLTYQVTRPASLLQVWPQSHLYWFLQTYLYKINKTKSIP